MIAETRADATERFRWLAVLFLAGGVFAAFALLVLPLPASVDRDGSWAVAGTACLLGGFVRLGERRLPAVLAPPLLLVATAVVSLGIHFWGSSPTDDAMFYVWIALYAAYFLSTVQTVVQLGAVGAAYAVALGESGTGQAGLTRWMVTLTTLAVAAAVTATLTRRLRAALREADTAAGRRERLLAQVQVAALTDELTGLPNRRAWEEHFAREIARARRQRDDVAVAVLDLDHFKRYNDERGHRSGDEMLCAAAQAWRGSLRAGDLLARYGGEEFALLLYGCGPSEALALVERLRAATPGGQTSSAGIAVWDGRESPERLLDRADGALYQAKADGRNRSTLSPEPAVEVG
ncbi:MAG: GGDEF domain-containing protein [Actinobacteria bacterium]|nr:MAG: GGDEF domain-containing protein [Actinomycetota bacterium]